jgi:hypothetical protein
MSSHGDKPQMGSYEESEADMPALFNRPGLPKLAYRIGTHQTFRHRMLAELHYQEIPDGPNRGARPLALLTTRADDDPSIALLDAWATVADVLTFYQERVANEGYLRTATERRSVLELARAIGYEFDPGVAASTFLKFTVEDASGAPPTASVPKGTKVQSIPDQAQLPQTFETTEQIEAHAAWNSLRPRLTESQKIQQGLKRLRLKGVNTQLQPGDGILIVGDERGKEETGSKRWGYRILQTVAPYPEEDYTLVTWEEGLGDANTPSAAKNPKVFAFRQRAALFGHNAPDWRTMPDMVKRAYRAKAGLPFDQNDPNTWGEDWPWQLLENPVVAHSTIDLDAAYPEILPGSWVVAVNVDSVGIYKVKKVSINQRADFTLTSKVSRLELDTNDQLGTFGPRDTVIFAQSELLELTDEPLLEPVHGRRVVLDGLVQGLPGRGRPLVVSGKRIRALIAGTATGLFLESADGLRRVALRPGDLLRVMAPPVFADGSPGAGLGPEEMAHRTSTPSPGPIRWQLMDRDGFVGFVTAESGRILPKPAAEEDPTVSEVAFLSDGADYLSSDRDRTTIELRDPLQNSYDRTTVAINANVARATHGETVRDEALGSGDGARANQHFALKKPPLTYVSAPTATGAKSTLDVYVNGVLWQEASSLFDLDDRSQSYVVRTDGDGQTRVIFGDGERGARLPTGLENVTSTYRSGIGLTGLVGADKLTLLQTRPLGIREVTNPLPATGAAEPEAPKDARVNAPLTVLTLDRIVSLKDFENFARAFAGIGKARAVAFWSGERRLVHVTVAAANGDEVLPASDLYQSLVRGIEAACDPGQRVEVASYERRTFNLSASILVDARYVVEDVKDRVRSELLRAFGFENREFGQPVAAAEVLKVMHAVEGVEAVDLDQLALDVPRPDLAESGQSPAILPARVASQVGEKTELLLLEPEGIKLEDMNP